MSVGGCANLLFALDDINSLSFSLTCLSLSALRALSHISKLFHSCRNFAEVARAANWEGLAAGLADCDRVGFAESEGASGGAGGGIAFTGVDACFGAGLGLTGALAADLFLFLRFMAWIQVVCGPLS